MAIGIGPGFLASFKRTPVLQPFRGNKTCECRHPMLVITRAVIGLAAVCGRPEFICKCGRPLFPSKMPLLRKFDGERKGLRLPGLSEDRTAVIARQARQARQ